MSLSNRFDLMVNTYDRMLNEKFDGYFKASLDFRDYGIHIKYLMKSKYLYSYFEVFFSMSDSYETFDKVIADSICDTVFQFKIYFGGYLCW